MPFCDITLLASLFNIAMPVACQKVGRWLLGAQHAVKERFHSNKHHIRLSTYNSSLATTHIQQHMEAFRAQFGRIRQATSEAQIKLPSGRPDIPGATARANLMLGPFFRRY